MLKFTETNVCNRIQFPKSGEFTIWTSALYDKCLNRIFAPFGNYNWTLNKITSIITRQAK